MAELKNIWTSSDCLSEKQLVSYLEDKLEREEIFMLEDHLSGCALCSDAIDGLMDSDILLPSDALTDIEERTNSRIQYETDQVALSNQNQNLKGHKGKKKRFAPFAAAASILLLIFGGWIVYSKYLSPQHTDHATLAKSQEVKGDYSESVDENSIELSGIETESKDKFSKKREPKIANKSQGQKEAPSELEEVVAASKTFVKENKAVPRVKRRAKPAVVAKNIPTLSKPAIAKLEEDSKTLDVSDRRQSKISSAVVAKQSAEEKRDIAYQSPSVSNTYQVPISRGKAKDLESSESISAVQKQSQYNASPKLKSKKQGMSRSSSVLKETAGDEVAGYGKKEATDDYSDGLYYYNKQEYRKSIRRLSKALKDASAEQKEDIQYHLAMSYLKLGRDDQAEPLLDALKKSSKYRIQSERMIQEIQSR